MQCWDSSSGLCLQVTHLLLSRLGRVGFSHLQPEWLEC